MLRESHILLCQNSKLLFRGQFGLYKTSIHKLLVVGLCLAHGIISDALHFLVALDGDADLACAVHVLNVDAALPVGKGVKG